MLFHKQKLEYGNLEVTMIKPKTLCILLITMTLMLLLPSVGLCGVPQIMSYHGVLTDTSGVPVTDGQYAVTFSIYAAPTGGASLWTETWNATTNPVAVTGGMFNVMLGAYKPIPASFFADNPVAYLGIIVGNDSEMLPRQRIASVGYAFTAGNGIPKGGIIMWSGAVNQVPEGWALCDGAKGTPDLRDRFIVGAGSAYAVGATGGEATHTLTIGEMPSHTHIQNAHTHIQDSHNHAQNPHRHTQAKKSVTDDGKEQTDVADNSTTNEWETDLATATNIAATATNQNTTATNQNTGGGAAHENRPPYYALAFIMKL